MNKVEEIIDIIENRKNRGHGLEHFKEYMKSIGNPETNLKSIHIAGTNGKGSTLNYLRSILQSAGYKVGTFSSPYLITHRDRIRINDEFISEDAFIKISDRYYTSWMEYDLSMFEIDMAIASIYFLEEKCDFCIFEVGLGGRLDSTNILHPMISVITNIGMDHMEQLGNTYELIAKEKGGIIKDGVSLVCGEEKQGCLEVFQALCEVHKSTMHLVQKPDHLVYQRTNSAFSYRDLKDLHILNGAHYQVKNATCALETIQVLRDEKQLVISDDVIINGLKIAQWRGRFETIYEHPQIIVDGAHNLEGILALQDTLQDFGKVRILFAALKDKETSAMLESLLQISEDVTVTQFPFYRAEKASIIARDYPVKVEENFKQAIVQSLEDKEMPLIITGSLYFISQVIFYMSEEFEIE